MSRKFQIKTVPSTWLEGNGRRLDCGPYLCGAIEATTTLEKHVTEPLKDLTTGYKGGIFNGPRFPRVYVDDIENGVPFLGSTDILEADLSYVSLLSKKQIKANPDLVIDEGWILITCSGTIGRMTFARSDMKGMAGSQHFMRVVPDIERIPPGYLYAFLSSRFGVPLVVSGTYGAIIQHIEPHHIASLPVPRLGEVEDRAHELIQKATDLRVEGANAFNEAKLIIDEILEVRGGDKPLCGLSFSTVSASSLLKRVDAAYHSPSAMRIERNIVPPPISWTDNTRQTQAAGFSARRCLA